MRPGPLSSLPNICKNLIILNAGVFIFSFLFGKINFADTFGLHYLNSPYFKPYQIFTYQFIHGSFFHIFFNMFGLFIFGSRLEQVWGERRFLFFYLFCVAGSAAFIFLMDGLKIYQLTGFFNPIDKIEVLPREVIQIYTKVTIGASGAIMGLMAAFAMLFPNTELYILFIPFPIKAKYLAIGYGIIELYLGITNSGRDNIAHLAHVGGLLVGVLLVLYWNKKDRNSFY